MLNLRSVAMVGICMLFFSSAVAKAGDLRVEVTGIKESNGEVIVTLFNGKTNWLKKKFLRQKTTAKLDKIEVVFEKLPDGEYAISAIHDINSSGDLDKNFIGMPSEPYGFSNDAAGKFGPPTFEQTIIVIDSDKKSISIRVK